MALEVRKRYPVPHASRATHKLPQRTYKKERRMKSFRRTMTTTFVLAILAVGCGIGYTWYMGQQKTAYANQAAPARIVRPIFKPMKAASDARVGVSTQSITSDVKPGDNASITIHTNPDATCDISVKYNNVLAVDSGLVTKVADEFGIASWAWTVSPSAPAGKWPVLVICKNKKYSAQVIPELIIKP